MVRTFKAHDTGPITHMKQVDGTALLVTIAENSSNDPIVKVWALDKTEKKTGAPKCLSSLGVHNGRKQFPVRLLKECEVSDGAEDYRSRPLRYWKTSRNSLWGLRTAQSR